MGQFFSQLMIANDALYKIGAQRLSSLDDTNNQNAIYIQDVYGDCLIELLEEHTWSFCLNMVPLATIAVLQTLPDMADGVNNPFALPPDFISAYRFSIPCRYRKQTLQPPYVAAPTLALLLSVAGPVNMMYVFENDDPTTYTSKFCNALSSKIAFRLCFKISEAASMVQQLAAQAKTDLISAIADDSLASSPDRAIANEWEIARLSGSPNVGVGPDNDNVGFWPGF
jgi:hypothetical protein